MRFKIEKTLRIKGKIKEREMKEEESSDEEDNKKKRKEIKDEFFLKGEEDKGDKVEKKLYIHNYGVKKDD